MPLVYSRRRLLAFAAFAIGWPRMPAAQQPTDQFNSIKDIGSWRVVSQYLNANAFLLDTAVVRNGAHVESAPPPNGGNAEFRIDYWGGEGPRSGYFPELTINTVGNAMVGATRKARLLADDKEVGTWDVTVQQKIDLKSVFGADLAGLRSLKTLKVLMTFGSDEVVIYEVHLADTDAVLNAMRQGPDAFYRSQPHPPPGQTPPGGCFITAACCEIVGLRDDCFELASLRGFRDGPLAATAGGRRDIGIYYAVAPQIVAEIRRRGEQRRLLAEYVRTIVPAAVAVRLGLVALPRQLYSAMMRRMIARYLGASTA
jgi:hypothetical protein